MKRESQQKNQHKRGRRARNNVVQALTPPTDTRQTKGDFSFCQEKECHFCEAKLYSGLPKVQVRDIRALLSVCSTGPGDTLFRVGDPSTYLYVIREGQIKLTRTDVNGHECLVGLVGPGYLLGFDTIGNPLYNYSAKTLTPSVFCRIKHGHIMKVLAKNSKVSLNVLLAVNEQLSQAHNLIRVLGQKTAVEKVAALLLNLLPHSNKNKVDDAGKNPQALHLSRNEMAEILGVTVETVSRIMAQFRRDAIIKAPRGSISIRKRKRLQALAGSPLQARRLSSIRARRAVKPPDMHARNVN
jgi:CRP/FNR family transcriptional regulator